MHINHNPSFSDLQGLYNIGGEGDRKSSLEEKVNAFAPTQSARADSSLEGRQIGVAGGDGKSGLSAAFAKIKDLFNRQTQIGEVRTPTESSPLLEARVSGKSTAGVTPKANDYVTALSTPKADSRILDARVVDKLMTHARQVGSPVSEQQVKEFVAVGERLLDSIRSADTGATGRGITVRDDQGRDHQISSNLHTTRAISWALMAQAAERDLSAPNDGTERKGNMVTEGSIVMKDPGNKLFDFLNSAPTSYGRASTHFNERMPSDAPKHKLFGTPLQRGIEDYQNMMPGKKGSLLFSNINPTSGAASRESEIFLKFEHGGTPDVFGSAGGGLAAIKRCLAHVVSTIASRRSHDGPSEGVQRKEHVHKDGLKASVWKPFESIVAGLKAEGILSKSAAKEAMAGAKKHGMESIENRLQALLNGELPIPKAVKEKLQLPESGSSVMDIVSPQLADQIRQLSAEMGSHRKALGDLETAAFGIGRRGAEVHLQI
ncbi:hypothetical protein RY831_16415 [Noviherbaspirillum sp. CPCC 100848]|uniref:Uncharacterized protein n=1 Tax=Noviherbaspirillum album TaxID=3080276 RepID=A0ABU6JC68_9BURK|nr:hypothetical protein [Noviherbaspirillum sp. CPCC 100848]MEC4720749.1 hypothetical protein [Noviherbaspirillum sp. CPCC 100848]